ncbi:MAG: 5'/3'-nucleotidase SurE [Candidatus Omnitrophica bacterium]|nr:5'/3'-nucleotidase SurE [Candidatus Omnitrophota bacterium]
MHILLTNDDGVHAPGLLAMKKELDRIAKVTVVAPDSERSSISQAITLNRPIYKKIVPLDSNALAHAVSGTPADCVKFALFDILKKKPDLIVSGINNGSNDGCSVFYSGTVGAAREGALLGVPSLAVSLDGAPAGGINFSVAARMGRKVAAWVLKNGLPGGTFLNVNVPDITATKIKGIRFTAQCRVPIHGEFRKRKDPAGRVYYWLTGRPPATNKDKNTDSFLLKKGFVTVVPVHCDATDHVFLDNNITKREIS